MWPPPFVSLWLLGLLGCFGGGGADLPTATAVRGPFDVVLSIPGELKAVKSVSMSSPDLGGQVKITWVIDEGARVEPGQVLVEFDQTELQTELENALNDLQIAVTKIDQKKAQLDVRVGDLDNDVVRAELGLERARMRVTESETVPLVEREGARIDVEESTLSVARARSALQSAKLEGDAELELLRLDAERAQKRVEKVQQRIDEATLKAPGPGLVILPDIWKGGSNGPIATGDTIWGGNTILTLPDLSAMEIEAWVHEVDAAKVAVDQPVSVIIDAHPEPSHAGTVKRVADLAVRRDRRKKVKHLKVMIDLETTTDDMKPGMTVRAEVRTEHLDEALAIPLEAVFHEGEQSFVWARSFGAFRRADVALGIANDTHVVITEGLSEGDVVSLVDPEEAARGEAPAPGLPSPSTAMADAP